MEVVKNSLCVRFCVPNSLPRPKKDIRMTPRIISLAKHASQHKGMVREEMEEKTKESSVMLAAGFEFVNRWTFVGD